MMVKRDLKKWCKELSSMASWVSLREYIEDVHSLGAKEGRVEEVTRNLTSGVMIEVMENGQFAYAATNSYDFQEIKRITAIAVANAQNASRYQLFSAERSMRPVVTGEYQKKFKRPFAQTEKAEAINSLVEISKKLKSHKNILSSMAYAFYVNSSMHYVCSAGSDFIQQRDLYSQDFFTIAQTSSEAQRRSYTILGQGSEPFAQSNIPWDEVDRVLAEALQLADAPNCPNDVRDLLIAPDQLYLQIHESIGHPLELDRIIGDERNYAGWSFVKPEDFGELQYGSKLLNITFDPTIDSELASYAIDDTGVKATKEFLIKEGKLLRGLGSLESQERSSIAGVASTRATSWNRAPIDRMANVNLEPGSSSLEDMISQVERGIYVQTNRSWSIDDYRNKFQFGCEFGQLIENGKLTKVVKNPNYRGITTPFWNNLKAVGDSETFLVGGSYYCGKGEPNQLIRVGHAMPAALFANIEVFGGEQ